MTDVLQIFKTAAKIEKPNYNTTTRQAIGDWENVVSKTGYLSDTTLILPSDNKTNPTIKDADLIILQDINGFDPYEVSKSWDCLQLPEWFKSSRKDFFLSNNLQLKGFSTLSKPWTFELFEFKKSEEGHIEIWLNYTKEIGVPKRQNHKIAVLKRGKSIRYRINSKDDFTSTGRKQRTFSEYDYVFHFLGAAVKIQFRDLNKIQRTKVIPKLESKLIDERKILN